MQAPFDAFIPKEMAQRAEDLGVQKANLDALSMFLLAVLAGAFIALGAVFATVTGTGLSDTLPFGIARVVPGIAFCLGLILVVVAGAELFTGNHLIVMAWASRKISTARLLRNWGLVYAGNFTGAVMTALLTFLAGVHELGEGQVGLSAMRIASHKLNLGWGQGFFLGVLCNALVCLAVWLCLSARSTTDKVLSILFPISAFVAAGFEHSIANMYFVPAAIFIRSWSPSSFWTAIEVTNASYDTLAWGRFLARNLVPVTLGNIVGGSVFVGLVYWVIYLRTHRA